MQYFGKKDSAYTATGIGVIVAFMLAMYGLSFLGLFGWFLSILMIVGLGAILGDFIHTWHIDFKFEKELDGFEEHLREALHLKKNDTLQ